MKRDFDQCLGCSHSRKMHWMGDQLISRCEIAEPLSLRMNTILFHDKKAWNRLELPTECIYYTERFVEDCNDEKI